MKVKPLLMPWEFVLLAIIIINTAATGNDVNDVVDGSYLYQYIYLYYSENI